MYKHNGKKYEISIVKAIREHSCFITDSIIMPRNFYLQVLVETGKVRHGRGNSIYHEKDIFRIQLSVLGVLTIEEILNEIFYDSSINIRLKDIETKLNCFEKVVLHDIINKLRREKDET